MDSQDPKSLSAMAKELEAVRKETIKSLSIEDYLHLRKVIWVNRLFNFLGIATAWIVPNPISALLMSFVITSKWTTVAHHVLHKGYDKVPGVPPRYTSHVFAKGWRRFIDWFDWFLPEAWTYEHNHLHHFFTNEGLDPDAGGYRYGETDRLNKYSKFMKYVIVIVRSSTWKSWYYSIITIKALHEKLNFDRRTGYDTYARESHLRNFFPYISYHFVLFPSLFLFIGTKAAVFYLINRVLAEFFANWHGFLIIVTNHTASDLYLLENRTRNIGEFYWAQILGSCNFRTGGFWNDYFHGYLNYQIEHHLFPDLPASKYAEIQPVVKSIIEKYGLPYRQESVFTRLGKLVSIITQKEKMQIMDMQSMQAHDLSA